MSDSHYVHDVDVAPETSEIEIYYPIGSSHFLELGVLSGNDTNGEHGRYIFQQRKGFL